MSMARQKLSGKIGTAIACVLIVVVYFFPIYILLNVSVRDITDLSSRLVPTAVPTLGDRSTAPSRAERPDACCINGGTCPCGKNFVLCWEN